MSIRKVFSVVLVSAVVFTACGGDSAESPSDVTSASVDIEGFAFATSELTVAAGTVVSWENKDSVGHTVTADDGSFDEDTGAGAVVNISFDTPGTFAYHCAIHPSMTGTVVVSG